MVRINVTKITVVRQRKGSDLLYVTTDLPSGAWPYDEAAKLVLSVTANTAETYLEEHFSGVPYTVVTS